MSKLPLVAIVGPTAVGKTALSLALARALPLEVVSVDSRQVYRGMDIGTAKPTVGERAQICHHLIDVIEPDEEFGLARYLELARTAIQDISRRDRTPLLVGGTGQYLWALLEAWRVPAVPPDNRLRRDLAALAESHGAEALHRRLAQVDPASARRIDPRNVRRVIRALEIHQQTGLPSSQLHGQKGSPFEPLIIGLTLPRQQLYDRIDSRIERMVEHRWIAEVGALLDRGISCDMPSMASVGYRELAAYLGEDVSLAEAIRAIKTNTHRLARQQYAWFRPSDPRIHWLQPGAEADDQAHVLLRSFLKAVR